MALEGKRGAKALNMKMRQTQLAGDSNIKNNDKFMLQMCIISGHHALLRSFEAFTNPPCSDIIFTILLDLVKHSEGIDKEKSSFL